MWQLLFAVIPMIGSVPVVAYVLKRVHYRMMHPSSALALTSGASSAGESIPGEIVEDDRDEQIAVEIASYKENKKAEYNELLEEVNQRAVENSEYHIYGYLKALGEKLAALDENLKLGSAQQQANLIYAKYRPLLKKVTEITSSKYYGDFVSHPDHWEHPAAMRKQVEAAVKSVAEEVANDIRNLNSSKELNFQVSVESLIGSSVATLPRLAVDSMEAIIKESQDNQLDSKNAIENVILKAQTEINTARNELEKANSENKKYAEKKSQAIQEELSEMIEAGESGIQGGSQGQIARIEDLKDGGEERFSKSVNKIDYTILKSQSKDSKKKFLASILDTITSAYKSEGFSSEFDAALWIDQAISKNSKNHPYRNHCQYCEEIKTARVDFVKKSK